MRPTRRPTVRLVLLPGAERPEALPTVATDFALRSGDPIWVGVGRRRWVEFVIDRLESSVLIVCDPA